MILLVDIGNTNIVLGCMENRELLFTARMATDRNKTEDEYELILSGILRRHNIEPCVIEGGIMSSVVPALKKVMKTACLHLTGIELLVVEHGMDIDLDIQIDAPEKLGSDLVVDAVACRAKYPMPCAVFDMGTATTMSVLDKDGRYIGGMIIPGMRVSIDALSARAAQLPYIELTTPPSVIGRNTVDCMQSGMIYGQAAMLDGLVDRVEETLGMPVTAVVTGGLGRIVAENCKRNIIYDDDLLLEGLRIIYEANKK